MRCSFVARTLAFARTKKEGGRRPPSHLPLSLSRLRGREPWPDLQHRDDAQRARLNHDDLVLIDEIHVAAPRRLDLDDASPAAARYAPSAAPRCRRVTLKLTLVTRGADEVSTVWRMVVRLLGGKRDVARRAALCSGRVAPPCLVSDAPCLEPVPCARRRPAWCQRLRARLLPCLEPSRSRGAWPCCCCCLPG